MMTGALLPSSSPTFLVAARARMPHPTSGEPVKVIIAMSGWSTSGSPTERPGPVTTLSSPGGSPHSSRSSRASAIAEQGVCDAGLSTTGQPGRDRGRDLVGDEVEREVERADRADHPDRHPQRERELARAGLGRVHRDELAGERARLDRRERERRHRASCLDPRRLDRLRRLVGDDDGELLDPLGEQARRRCRGSRRGATPAAARRHGRPRPRARRATPSHDGTSPTTCPSYGERTVMLSSVVIQSSPMGTAVWSVTVRPLALVPAVR